MPFLNDLEVSTEEEKIIIHYNYGILEKSPSVQHIEWRKNDKLLNLENEKYIGGNLKAKHLQLFHLLTTTEVNTPVRLQMLSDQ